MFPSYNWVVAIVAVVTVLGGVVAHEDKPHSPDMMDSTIAMSMENMEESTESPLADMALLSDTEPKKNETKTSPIEAPQRDTQRHTVADFIIHPLIAFKPRTPEDTAQGKQAASDSVSSTTASPWQLFGFNAGQGFGSSVSSLAGSVTGWLNDRIPLPALVDTPVRGQSSTSSSSSTTTTTTLRPDVVVRVQHRASTRAPLIEINNKNRPNRPDFEDDDEDDEDDDNNNIENNFDDDDEDDDDENDVSDYEDDEEDQHNQVAGGKRRGQNNNNNNNNVSDEYDDDNDDYDNDDGYEDEENNVVRRPNHRRHPVQPQGGNRIRNGNRLPNRNQRVQHQRRKVNANRNGNGHGKRRFDGDRPRQYPAYPVQYDDSNESYEDDDGSEEFYYGARPSTKRSQSSSFMQRMPQSFLNQIRQLTRGQTPAEIGSSMRKPPSSAYATKKRPQQATLLINRNGQTVYMAPELMQPVAAMPNMYYPQQPVVVRNPTSRYPQPPLTLPLKRKGRPTQYITIPWSQLGISPPSELVSVTDAIQSQPLILNIPQSAINNIQSPNRKKKRPAITAEAVPLLAEASLMDVFKPPQIPPSRTATKKPASASGGASKKKPSPTKKPALLPQRVRPATIVEMAPAMDTDVKSDEPAQSEVVEAASTESKPTQNGSNNNNLRSPIMREEDGSEYIIVGDDNEPGLTRQVQPVYGDARYRSVLPYLELVNRKHFGSYRKQARALSDGQIEAAATEEQQIPVQIIEEGGEPVPASLETASVAPANAEQQTPSA